MKWITIGCRFMSSSARRFALTGSVHGSSIFRGTPQAGHTSFSFPSVITYPHDLQRIMVSIGPAFYPAPRNGH